MEEKVLVSIITVAFNSEKTITNTIESVLNQSYNNVQYILIDGKSKDNTVKIFQNYEKEFKQKGVEQKWFSEPDKGIYDAMNKGIKMSTGHIIGFVNSDDYLEKNAISKVVQAYENNKNSDIFHGDINMIIQNQNTSFQKKKKDNIIDFKFNGMPVNFPATFIKRSVYDHLGIYDDSYKNAGDYEFILRCLFNNIKFYRIPEVISNMRDGGQSDDFRTTFKETRNINILYKCNYFIAWRNYLFSLFKAVINTNVKKNRFLFKVFYNHK